MKRRGWRTAGLLGLALLVACGSGTAAGWNPAPQVVWAEEAGAEEPEAGTGGERGVQEEKAGPEVALGKEEKPGETEPENQPGETEGAEPENQPGEAEGAEPENRPGEAEGTEPENQPGEAEGAEPGNQPGEAEGAEPENQPGEAEGAEPEAGEETESENPEPETKRDETGGENLPSAEELESRAAAFFYEDAWLRLRLWASPREESALNLTGAALWVEYLATEEGMLRQMQQYAQAEAGADETAAPEVLALRFHFFRNGEELDGAGIRLRAEVMWKSGDGEPTPGLWAGSTAAAGEGSGEAAGGAESGETMRQLALGPEIEEAGRRTQAANEGAVPVEVPWEASETAEAESIDRVLWLIGQDGSLTEAGAGPAEPIEATWVELAGNGVLGAVRQRSVADPAFTVEYFARIDRVTYDGANENLSVIDTSGGVLPTRENALPKRKIRLTEAGEVAAERRLEQVYAPEACRYSEKLSSGSTQAENLNRLNKLAQNPNYTLQEVWVQTGGEGEFSVYDPAAVRFTNVPTAAADTVQITENTVLRLVYESNTGSYTNEVALYDYDITNGQDSEGRWRSGVTGINAAENYGVSGNGQRTWGSFCDVLAFGNSNCGTGMGGYRFDGGALNAYNRNNADAGYRGCTFGLVDGLDEGGRLIYNPWVVAPALFQEGSARGKQTYEGGSLHFLRSGDTYTLSAVSGPAGIGAGELERLQNPSSYTSAGQPVTHSHIFTNNFWPMDGVPENRRTDPLMGGFGALPAYAGFADRASGDTASGWVNKTGTFPISDDGQAHNFFFGLNFAVRFDLSRDYVGPLDYLFFGDDDMWVFLTDRATGESRLVCDIGGVHSSVGEYVDLWDYIPREGRTADGSYLLHFFYTERGASGSTCYMRFTLPSVSSATTVQDTGSLAISKAVEGPGAQPEHSFAFRLHLTGGDGLPLADAFPCTLTDGDGPVAGGPESLGDGASFALKPGQTLWLRGLPVGTAFTVTEENPAGYSVSVNGLACPDGSFSGKITGDEVCQAAFLNRAAYVLPAAGGGGLGGPLGSGGLLLVLAGWEARRKGGRGQAKKRKE